jgi:soluble lytic murein transglycosylase-like protein
MLQVLDRIDEIVRRCNPQIENTNRSQSAQNRFVELLEIEKKGKEDKRTGSKGSSASMGDLGRVISRAADDYNIDEELIRAVIQVESAWRRDAVSIKGAMGLMQLMPRTAAMLGVDDAFDPEQNIEGGVKYLAQLTDKYHGDVEKALAAYNAGPSRVDKAGGIPPIQETQRYVHKVMELYHRYREET